VGEWSANGGDIDGGAIKCRQVEERPRAPPSLEAEEECVSVRREASQLNNMLGVVAFFALFMNIPLIK